MRPWLLVCCCCCLCCCALPSALAEFFEPKGPLTPDKPKSAQIDQPFRVFGTEFPSGTLVYANTPIGRISIDGPSTGTYTPGSTVSKHLLQPFETYVDISGLSPNLYYANISGGLLGNMSELVRANFLQKSNFTATGGHLFTWENMKPETDPSKINTFQVALLYDAWSTYAVFNYLTVTTKYSIRPIMAGFTRANSLDVALLPFTGDSALRLPMASGTADRLPGRFIYRVDTWPPLRGGCLSEDPPSERDRTLFSTLGQDSVLGGGLAIVSSRCPDAGATAVCQVSVGGQQLAESPAVRCNRCGAAFWACEAPPSLRAGLVNLTLKVSAQPAAYSAEFVYVNPDSPSVTKILLSDSIDSWMQTDPATLMITYNTSETMNGSLKLQVVGYSEAGLSTIGRPEDFNKLTKVLYEGPASSSGVMNLGGRTVRCPAGSADCESYHVGFLRILDSSTPANSIKSRIIPLGWFVHPYYLDKQSPSWFTENCKAWSEAKGTDVDRVRTELLKLTCPGRLNRTVANPGQYLPITYCPTLAGGCGSATPKQRCFVSRPMSGPDVPAVPAAVCCYGEAGDLLYQELTDEGGALTQRGSSSLRSHPHGQLQRIGQALLPGQASFLSHWYWDLLPQLYCCRWARGGLCHLRYMQSRPTPRSATYSAGGSAHMVGDPHVTGYGGRPFLFNGVGEFWLLLSDSISVQGRFQALPGITEASFLTGLSASAAPGGLIVEVTIQGGNRLLIQRRRPSSDSLQSAVVALSEPDKAYLLEAGVTVQFTAADSLTLQLANGKDSVGVALKSVGNITYLDLYLTLSESMKGRTRGLLGQWTNDPAKEFLDAQGNIAAYTNSSAGSWEQFHRDFCLKNQLTNVTESLFGYSGFISREAGFGTMQNVAGYAPVFSLPSTANPQENSVCGADQDCVFDIRVTQKPELAAATAANGRLFSELRAANGENASVCDVPGVPGIVITQALTVGVSLSLVCAQPLQASRQAQPIVCSRQADRSVAWVPDPAGLGIQCGLDTLVISQANIGLIVGIVVPVVVLLIVAIVLIVCLVTRRSRDKRSDTYVAGTQVQMSQQSAGKQQQQPGDQRTSRPGTHDELMSKAGEHQQPHTADGGNRRNPKGMPPPPRHHQASPPPVAAYHDAEAGGQFAPLPTPRRRTSADSYQSSQHDPVMAANDGMPGPHQQQPPAKPRPMVSHSEVV